MRGILYIIAASILFLMACASSGQLRTGKAYEKVVTHKVSDEDTWPSIAEAFYGEAERAFQLAEYNGSVLDKDPERGSGVKVPMTRRDIERFEKRLDAVKKYNRGLELASDGRYRDASERFREALKLDPFLSDASFNLALTYQKLSLYKNAATVLQALIVRKKENPEYYYALGVSYFHMRDYKKAGRSFLDALSLNDCHLKSLFSLAVIHEKTGKDSEAEKCWERYLEISGEGEWAEEARSRLESLRGKP
ncbi:MAG: tetratricopeptide repeat protein [Candidatus Krumholzibacteriota bacterium]|nr:tetratricopeptide repeat protein [Candidatus Krumholzibacteriota bacterium]